jgi:hypothetical protein
MRLYVWDSDAVTRHLTGVHALPELRRPPTEAVRRQRERTHGGRDLGGGYPYRAIVAEVQPIHQPPKIGRILWSLCLPPVAAAATRMTAQTIAQPML